MRFEGPLREEFKKAVRYWADHHPAPDKVCFSKHDHHASPRQIANEVEKESAFGQYITELFEIGATAANQTAEQVIARLHRPYQP